MYSIITLITTRKLPSHLRVVIDARFNTEHLELAVRQLANMAGGMSMGKGESGNGVRATTFGSCSHVSCSRVCEMSSPPNIWRRR